MATYFSNHYTSTGIEQTAVDAGFRVSAAISHGRVRYKRADATGLFLTTDTVRMFTMQSGYRLLELWLSSDGYSGAGAINIGLHKSGNAHDGLVIDADLFATAQTTSTIITRTNMLSEGGSAAIAVATESAVNGLPLWQLAAMGAGTDTSDPGESWDFTITPSTSHTTNNILLTLEAYYTAGD